MKTRAIFFPFHLFGSAGAGTGAELLADAFAEMLADNRREQVPTRARSYQDHVRTRELKLETLADLSTWRERARRAVHQAWSKGEFLLWVAGNHLGALPMYDELAGATDTLVVQLDAHLDIYNLSDCTEELSHGNFLLHSAGPLPPLVNIGHRELLLRPEYIRQYYQETFPAAELAIEPERVRQKLGRLAGAARRIVIDLDCDVFDPAFFPAVTQPVPFGLSPQQVLQVLDTVWSERVVGVAISEFDPGRDHNDRCLATLVWLLEYLLLRRHEATPPPGRT